MKERLQSLLVRVVAILIIFILHWAGTMRVTDRWVQDWLYQKRSSPTGEIILIGIDEETLARLGPYGPGYRDFMAYALEELASDPNHLPAVVAIDILYEGESGTAADDRLAQAAQKLGCVVTASMAEFGEIITWEDGRAQSRNASAVVQYVEPFAALREVTVQGHINAMNDKDGIMRHAMMSVVKPDGARVNSMAITAAQLYKKAQGKELALPQINAGGHYYVPYTGKPGDFSDGFNLYQLMTGQIPSAAWAGKIVLIGPYAAALQDSYFTSISKAEPMYGVEIQANVIQSLLNGNLKTEVSDGIQIAVIVILCIAAVWLFFNRRLWVGAVICAGLILFGFVCSWLLYLMGYVAHILWLPVAVLLLFLSAIIWHYWMAAKARRKLELEKERIATELALATRIQASSLPKVYPDRTEFSLCASMTPAKEVGGDLYDFFLIDDDHLCLVIGDVSGKGVPASLFMMLAGALIHHVAMHETSPAKILTEVNAEICARNPEEMFVTVWLGVLQISTGLLAAASAGHEYPAMKRPDGSFELVKDRHGFVIGGMEGVRYREYTLQMDPGSKIFVYTDGVPEATNGSEEMFGTDRMISALQAHEQGTPEEILKTVKESVASFVGEAQQFDDLTMLCLAYHGANPASDSPAE